MANQAETEKDGRELWRLAQLFLKLGTIAFGGPAAHIAMMRTEVVERRRWIEEQEFLDLVGATNLIPGPNSTELAIHLGRVRAGWRGLLVAGACFILPATLIVLAFAWAYDHYGSTPQAEGPTLRDHTGRRRHNHSRAMGVTPDCGKGAASGDRGGRGFGPLLPEHRRDTTSLRGSTLGTLGQDRPAKTG